MITISLSEALVVLIGVLLLLAAVALIVSTFYLARLASQATRTASEVERAVRLLTPRADNVLQLAEGELQTVKSITGRVERIAVDAEYVSREARKVAANALSRVEAAIDSSVRHAEAVIAGLKAGARVFQDSQQTAAESS